MTPLATTSSSAPKLDVTSCDCADCTALRNGLVALAEAGGIPAALLHDDGRPVMVTVADQTITAAEARLRLMLLDPQAPSGEVRAHINRLRTEYEHGRWRSEEPLREAIALITKQAARAAGVRR